MKVKVILSFIISACLNTVFASEEITVAIGEWEPFIGNKLLHYGVVSHIVSEVFAESQIKVKYEFYPWKRSYLYVKKGKCHASAIWGKTDEREKDCYFSDVVYTDESVLFYRKDHPVKWQGDHDKLVQLNGLKIGSSLGSAKARILAEADRNGFVSYEIAGDKLTNFKKLLAKRFDAIDDCKTPGLYILRKYFSKEQQNEILFVNCFEKWQYYLLFSKKIDENKRYLEIFNSGLKKMKEDGRFEKMWSDFYNGKYN